MQSSENNTELAIKSSYKFSTVNKKCIFYTFLRKVVIDVRHEVIAS